MGTFNVTIEVAAGSEGPFETFDARVDADAAFTRVPSTILHRLGVEPTERRRFVTANGKSVERDVGWAVIRIDEEESTTLTVFGEGDADPVVGMLTLTTLGLQADPVQQRLVPALAYLPGIVLAPDLGGSVTATGTPKGYGS